MRFLKGDTDMVSDRVLGRLAVVVISIVLVTAGCGEKGAATAAKPQVQVSKPATGPAGAAVAEANKAAPAVEPNKAQAAKQGAVRVAIKPRLDDLTTYKVTTESKRTIAWEGSVPDKQTFKENRNESRVELVYTQRIIAVDEAGRAAAQITVKSLKCSSVVKNETRVDFDSSRPADVNNPLAKMIGQSYSVEFTPDNRVPTVFDLAAGRTAVGGVSPASQMGLKILSPEVIQERHGTLALPAAGEDLLAKGDNWKKIRTFSFGLMGVKSFEKIYTLSEVKKTQGRQVVRIDMNAIPTAEIEKHFTVEETGGEFPKMFDSNDVYKGEAEVDLTSGWVEKCREELRANWFAALPAEEQDPNKGPIVLKMSENQLYDLERIR
jgi:hypothetical protein